MEACTKDKKHGTANAKSPKISNILRKARSTRYSEVKSMNVHKGVKGGCGIPCHAKQGKQHQPSKSCRAKQAQQHKPSKACQAKQEHKSQHIQASQAKQDKQCKPKQKEAKRSGAVRANTAKHTEGGQPNNAMHIEAIHAKQSRAPWTATSPSHEFA